MLKYKRKPYTENQIQYYSYINYNYSNGYLIEEDNILESIDPYLPTANEMLEQRKRYNDISKRIDKGIIRVEPKEVYVVFDKDGSAVEWDKDTYEMMKERYNVSEL